MAPSVDQFDKGQAVNVQFEIMDYMGGFLAPVQHYDHL
jgi:hypothetical protein